MLESVDARDRYTVVFTLKEPFASFPINSRDADRARRARVRRSASIRSAPGPYRFVALRRRRSASSWRAFDDYFGGRPRNDGLVLKIVPDDIMRGLELRKGTIDIVVNDIAARHRVSAAARAAAAGGRVAGHRLSVHRPQPARSDSAGRARAAGASATPSIARRSSTTCAAGLATPAVGILPPRLVGVRTRRARLRLRSGEGARAARRGRLSAIPTATGPQPRLRLSLKMSNIEFNRLQSAVIQQNLRARRHRARRADLRVRHAVRRRAEGQLPAVHAAVGRRRRGRSRHPAARVPFDADAAGRLQSRLLQRSAGRRLLDEAAVATDDRGRVARFTARSSRSSRRMCPTSACGTRPTSPSRSGRSPAFTCLPLADFIFLKDVARMAQARAQ